MDVWIDGGIGSVDCFFRDSHADDHGVERVVHEYTARATVDPETDRIVASEAIAGALPYPECPGATASAERLAGVRVVELRDSVSASFVGPTTCTHLNDTLRALEDAGALLRALG